MSVVTVTNITKTYNDITALNNVSLSIEHGDFHCIVGPNGSGKSTLFRILLGLTKQSAGEMERPEKQNIGGAFQEPCFYPSLTVKENLSIFKTMTDSDSEWIETIMEQIGLSRVKNRVAGELSGGYQKKLDITLGLIHEPDLFLLDEPLADLDDVTRTELVSFLSSYAGGDKTVVVATHNVEHFSHTLDRLTIMEHGEVEVDAEKEELRPQDDDLHQMYVDMVSDVNEDVTESDIV